MPDPQYLIIRPESAVSIDRGNGVVTTPYAGQWNLDEHVINTGTAVFEAGREMPLHTHNVEESVLVLEGVATVQVGDEHFELEAGCATWVSAGTPHRYANRSAAPMRMYWGSGGPHVTRTLMETGETFEHLSPEEVQSFSPE